MTTVFLHLRTQLALVKKQPSKRLFFDGPVAVTNGLCFSRGFQAEMLKTDRDAQRLIWHVSTRNGPYDFILKYFIKSHFLAGMGTSGGVAVYEDEQGALLWNRPDVRGLAARGERIFSTVAGGVVEIDVVTGEDQRRTPIGNMRFMGMRDYEAILCPRYEIPLHTLDSEKRLRELQRPLCAINLDTDELLWERDIASEVWEASQGQAPHYVANMVPGSLGESWIGRWRESTFACSRKDGSLQWFAPYALGLVADVNDGRVFGMDEAGLFYVLDERTGALLSRHDGTGLEGARFPRPAAMLGPYAVYGMESGHVAVFDPRDGRLVWSKRHKSGTPNVGVVDGRVYVTTEKGELLVYEPTVPIE